MIDGIGPIRVLVLETDPNAAAVVQVMLYTGTRSRRHTGLTNPGAAARLAHPASPEHPGPIIPPSRRRFMPTLRRSNSRPSAQWLLLGPLPDGRSA